MTKTEQLRKHLRGGRVLDPLTRMWSFPDGSGEIPEEWIKERELLLDKILTKEALQEATPEELAALKFKYLAFNQIKAEERERKNG